MKYTIKTIDSATYGSKTVDLHRAESDVEELLSDGYTLDYSRVTDLKSRNVYMSQSGEREIFEYDFCFILKKPEAQVLNS